ncbi:MAG TPA: META domain-containing protein [Chitinophagaceae bacterium]|nr:META domain-containing protein [Chitinophagaceae bacterium]
MKQFILASLVVGLLGSCTGSRNSTAQLQNLNGNWELTVFPHGSKPFAELFTMKKPELEFNSTTMRVSGNTGCNRTMGEFSVNGDELRLTNMASTKMGCPGYDESIFMNALNRVNRFRLNGDQLSLLQDSTLLMTFVKKSS